MRFLATTLLLAAISLSAQDAPKKQGGGRQPPKNLKILPADQNLGPTMRTYTVALGQRCDFCHVQGDFSADDKAQKLTARKMIEMVNHVNGMLASDGKVVVTCYTCHRGKNMPET